MAEDAAGATKGAKILSAVAMYWVISISMVFVNKTLLSSDSAKIDAPLFITWYQCIVTVLVVWLLGELGIAKVPKFEIKKELLPKMLPLSVVFTGMILFNNLTLKYVEVSFYQVARSLTIFFNVVFDYIVLGNATSPKAMACVFMVIMGFAVGNGAELRWTWQGVVFGVTASFMVAMNAIYVKKKFPLVDNDPWKITAYNNVISSILFIPAMFLFGEHKVVMASDKIYMGQFWFLMTIGGALGVLISFATAMQIKQTSPLTHNISATAKAAGQTVLAVMWYKNPVNIWGWGSVFTVLGGSLLYTLVRRQEMQARDKAKAEAEKEGGEVETKVPMVSAEEKPSK